MARLDGASGEHNAGGLGARTLVGVDTDLHTVGSQRPPGHDANVPASVGDDTGTGGATDNGRATGACKPDSKL